MLLPSTRVPVHARFWKACIVCGRGPCKSTASALLRTKGRRVARKASAAVCEHCGGMRTAPALHWVFGESWAWAGGHTRWAPRLWRHGTFVKDLDSCVDSHMRNGPYYCRRVCMHTARVLTKCPRVSLNTFCAATCSNLYHISHTHPVQIALRFHFINGSRSPAPQQSEEIRRKEMRLCRSPHNTRASESHYADTQRDWPDIAVAIAEAHHRSHSRQPRRALLQHGQQ
jgi:hypothetical protein